MMAAIMILFRGFSRSRLLSRLRSSLDVSLLVRSINITSCSSVKSPPERGLGSDFGRGGSGLSSSDLYVETDVVLLFADRVLCVRSGDAVLDEDREVDDDRTEEDIQPEEVERSEAERLAGIVLDLVSRDDCDAWSFIRVT